MICPRVQAARGSRHYSNCLWPTQLWHSLLRTCGDSCLLGRRGGCWGCWGCWDCWDRWDVTHPYWPFGPLDHWDHLAIIGPLLDHWASSPAMALPCGDAGTSSTTVHNRPQPSTARNSIAAGFEMAASFKTAARRPPSRYESDAMFHLRLS